MWERRAKQRGPEGVAPTRPLRSRTNFTELRGGRRGEGTAPARRRADNAALHQHRGQPSRKRCGALLAWCGSSIRVPRRRSRGAPARGEGALRDERPWSPLRAQHLRHSGCGCRGAVLRTRSGPALCGDRAGFLRAVSGHSGTDSSSDASAGTDSSACTDNRGGDKSSDTEKRPPPSALDSVRCRLLTLFGHVNVGVPHGAVPLSELRCCPSV